MTENPLHALFQAADRISSFIQTSLSNFIAQPHQAMCAMRNPFFDISSSRKVSPSITDASKPQPNHSLKEGKYVGPVTKEEVGRATWTFLHTLAAQYPDKPTRQQRRDVKELIAILSRMYPCKECADHFKEVLRENPVYCGSHDEFSQWLCHVHNVVNRSLGKPIFPYERVEARWGKLECENRACDVLGNE